MYASNYGFPNAAGGPSTTFNGAPPPHNTHLQPGQGPTPNQSQQQHMMYNHPHQFPMGAPGGGGFPGGPNMMPGAGPAAGMMQNAGMPMAAAAANGQMPNYPVPYSNSPYGAGIPSSVAPQMNLPPNYAMGGGMPMSGFPIHPGQMPPQQQMMQRMQPPQSNAGGMPASTPQRPFPGQGQGGPGSQGTPTPNNALSSQQSQFATPQQGQGTPQGQAPNNTHQQPQQPSSTTSQTPQTPTFPNNVQAGAVNGSSLNSTPLSPGSESREKERVAVILEINNELLLEAVQLQHTKLAAEKEKDGHGSEAEKDSSEESKLLEQDYLQVMRRLQANLSYLATLADKKPNVQAQPCPAYLKPPPLHIKVKFRQMALPDGVDSKPELPIDREETAKYMQELYTKMQGLFPGIDPSKEPAFVARPPTQGQGVSSHKPGSSQASPVPGNAKTPKMSVSMPLQAQTGHPTTNATP